MTTQLRGLPVGEWAARFPVRRDPNNVPIITTSCDGHSPIGLSHLTPEHKYGTRLGSARRRRGSAG